MTKATIGISNQWMLRAPHAAVQIDNEALPYTHSDGFATCLDEVYADSLFWSEEASFRCRTTQMLIAWDRGVSKNLLCPLFVASATDVVFGLGPPYLWKLP